MAFLLLLALILVAGIAILQFSRAIDQRSFSQLFFAFGFVFLGLGVLAQLLLGFTLDETAAKLFFLARCALTLAWFGQGMLILLLPERQLTRWLTYGILAVTLVMFALVFFTRVTEAQDWYSTSKPVYSQIGDLLATNRPTRWGALALNLYGFALLAAAPTYHLIAKTNLRAKSWVSAVLLGAGALGLSIPLYFPPVENNSIFYLMELLTPIALFVGLRNTGKSDPKLNRKLR